MVILPSDGKLRAVGYIRVSRTHEGSVSPGIQRDEITTYAQRKGWTVVEFFEDLDRTGRNTRRPGLQSMLLRAQQGEIDVVVFYRLDRMSREPSDYYALLALFKDAGVQVDSVGQPFLLRDLATGAAQAK
jgi:DNA invertase Pin-like site-specific DNA recombinase